MPSLALGVGACLNPHSERGTTAAAQTLALRYQPLYSFFSWVFDCWGEKLLMLRSPEALKCLKGISVSTTSSLWKQALLSGPALDFLLMDGVSRENRSTVLALQPP